MKSDNKQNLLTSCNLTEAAATNNLALFKSLLLEAKKIAKNFTENERHYQNILKIVLNQPDVNGKTILCYIVLNKSIEMLELLKNFSKVDTKDNDVVCGEKHLVDLMSIDDQQTDFSNYLRILLRNLSSTKENDQRLLSEKTFSPDDKLQEIFKECLIEEKFFSLILNWYESVWKYKMRNEKPTYSTYIDYAIKKESLLHWACSLDNAKAVVTILLKYHKANDITTFQKFKQLFIESSQHLLQLNNSQGRTPLHICVCSESDLTFLLLLQLGAVVQTKTQDGETALHVATAKGRSFIVNKLLECDATNQLIYSVDRFRRSALHLSILGSHIDISKKLINYGQEKLIKLKDVEGNNLLHAAVMSENVDMIKMMLEYNLDINEKNINKLTPLHLASRLDSNLPLETLLQSQQDIDLNSKDDFGRTCLLIAAKHGKTNCFKSLYNQPTVDRLITDFEGMNILHFAVTSSNCDIVQIVLLSKERIKLCNGINYEGKTPITLAVIRSENKILEIFVKSSVCNQNFFLNNSNSLFNLTARKNKQPGLLQLLQNGMKQIKLQSFKRNSPLIEAVLGNNIENVYYLLNCGAEPNFRDAEGYTALGYCAVNDSVQIAKVLTSKGASVDSVSFDSVIDDVISRKYEISFIMSPLQIACKSESPKMTSFLLDEGAKVSFRGEGGLTAMEIAIKYQNKSCIDALLQSSKWKTVLRCYRFNKDMKICETPLRQLLRSMPEAALSVLNRCINITTKNSIKEKVTLNMEFLDDTYSCHSWKVLNQLGEIYLSQEVLPCFTDKGKLQDYAKPYSKSISVIHNNHPLKIIMDTGNSKLINHPLVRGLVHRKWSSFTNQFYYMKYIITYIFVLGLTSYMFARPPPQSYTTHPCRCADYFDPNISSSCPCCTQENKLDVGTAYVILEGAIFIYTIVQFFFAVVKLFSVKFTNSLNVDNIIEMIVSPPTLWLVNEFEPCMAHTGVQSVWKWQLSSVTVLLNWLYIGLLARNFPKFGIYVIMVWDILKSFSKASLILFEFFIGFAFFFYMVLGNQDAYKSWYLSILKSIVMIIGELDFEKTFILENVNLNNKTEIKNHLVPYEALTLFGFIFFVILFPIIIMNLLIGLAVDDIKAVMENARTKKILKEMELTLKMESLLPRRLTRLFARSYINIQINSKKRKRTKWSQWIFKSNYDRVVDDIITKMS